MAIQPAPADVVRRENFDYVLGFCAAADYPRVRVVLRDGSVVEGKATTTPPDGVGVRLSRRRIIELPWEVSRAPLRELRCEEVDHVERLVPHRGRQTAAALLVTGLAAVAGWFVPPGANDHPLGYVVMFAILGLLVGTLGALFLGETPPMARWLPVYSRDER